MLTFLNFQVVKTNFELAFCCALMNKMWGRFHKTQITIVTLTTYLKMDIFAF